MTSFEATKSVFNITEENNSFSGSTLNHRFSRGGAETINRLQKLLELRIKKYIELHVKEVEEKGLKLIKDFSLARLDTHKKTDC